MNIIKSSYSYDPYNETFAVNPGSGPYRQAGCNRRAKWFYRVKGWFCNRYLVLDSLVNKSHLFFIIFLFCGYYAPAQYALGVEYHPYLHTKDVVSSPAVTHFSVSWRNESIGERYWAKKWDVKNISIESGMFEPGRAGTNEEVWYSNRWYVAGAMNFRLWHRKKWSLGLQPAFGIVWLPDQNDMRIEDHYLLGSQLNNLFAIAPQIDWRVSDRFLISGNIRLNHISNGGRVLPNRGLNYTTAGLGLYYLWEQTQGKPPIYKKENDDKFSYSLATGLGIKAVKDKSRSQGVNMWQLAMQYRPGYKIGWILSTDYFLTWNPAEEKSPQRVDNEDWPGRTLGMAPGIRLHFGKLKLVGQIGTYIWSEKKMSENLYQNVGFEYRLLSHWSAIAYMRLHTFDTADCMVFGIRYNQTFRK